MLKTWCPVIVRLVFQKGRSPLELSSSYSKRFDTVIRQLEQVVDSQQTLRWDRNKTQGHMFL